jgi:hypothetical protein
MPEILTSWKDIAQYLGKGVRTAQRWEQQFGLPIRRQSANSHRAIVAIRSEIDAWVYEKAHFRREGKPESETERLRRKVQELQEQNSALRRQLEAVGEDFNAQHGREPTSLTVGL